MPLSAADYLVGWAFLALTLLACAVVAGTIVRRRLDHLTGAERALALFLVGSAAFVLAHLLPGAAGVLSPWTVLVVCALMVVGVRRLHAASRSDGAPHEGGDAIGLGTLGAIAAAGGAVAFLAARVSDPVVAVDALTMHLPQVARYIQAESFWELVQYAPQLSNATYPQNGTVALLGAVLPWEDTWAVRFVNLPLLVAMAVAVFAAARELGAPRSASVLAGALATAMPAVNEPALDQAQVDTAMLAWFSIGGVFLLRAARTGRRSDLVLAALGLGLAFGTKWYAVAYVPVLVLAWLVTRRRPIPWRDGALLAGIVAAAGGFWLVRNWILTGNPVHPARVSLFGLTVFDAPPDTLRDFAGFTVSDYAFDAGVWRDHFLPAFKGNFGIAGPVLIVLGLAAAVVAVRRRDGRAAVVLAVAVAMGLLYTVLPDTAFGPPGEPVLTGANARYLVPALLAAIVAVAWLAGRARIVEVVLLVAIVEGVVRSYRHDVGIGHLVVAAAVLAAAALLRRRAALVLAVAAIAGGWALVDRTGVAAYAQLDPVIGWVQDNVEDGERVALGGVWTPGRLSPVLPSFGAGLDGRVEYLGRFVDDTLQRWPDRDAFQDQLRARRYRAVIIGTGVPERPGGEQPEAGWARELGYVEVARSPHLVLLSRRAASDLRRPSAG